MALHEKVWVVLVRLAKQRPARRLQQRGDTPEAPGGLGCLAGGGLQHWQPTSEGLTEPLVAHVLGSTLWVADADVFATIRVITMARGEGKPGWR